MKYTSLLAELRYPSLHAPALPSADTDLLQCPTRVCCGGFLGVQMHMLSLHLGLAADSWVKWQQAAAGIGVRPFRLVSGHQKCSAAAAAAAGREQAAACRAAGCSLRAARAQHVAAGSCGQPAAAHAGAPAVCPGGRQAAAAGYPWAATSRGALTWLHLPHICRCTCYRLSYMRPVFSSPHVHSTTAHNHSKCVT